MVHTHTQLPVKSSEAMPVARNVTPTSLINGQLTKLVPNETIILAIRYASVGNMQITCAFDTLLAFCVNFRHKRYHFDILRQLHISRISNGKLQWNEKRQDIVTRTHMRIFDCMRPPIAKHQ